MFRISIFLLLFTLYCSNLFGNQRIHFALPQNVFTKGELVPFLLKGIDPNYNQLPVTITVHACKDLKLVLQQHLLLNNKNPSYTLTLPEKMYEGSYVISAYVLEFNKPKIIESHAIVFHVIDQGISDQYYTFREAKSIISDSSIEKTKVKCREKLTNINPTDNIKFSVDQSYYVKPKMKSEIHTGIADTLHRLYFKSDRVNNLIAFFQHNRKPLNLVASNDNNFISGELSPDELHQKHFVFDAFTNKPIDLSAEVIPLPFLVSDFVSMDTNEIDHINGLSNNASLNQKINHLLFEIPIINNLLPDVKIDADNTYELKNYQEFESLMLFIKEVVLPAKLVTASKNKEQLEIIILSGVNKKWYPQKALLMIDGLPIQNHAKIKELVWKDISSIQLFRKIETLRKYYGSMGRSGVIEITTKNKSTPENLKLNLIENVEMFRIKIDDTRPFLKPLQFLGENTDLIHGDRIGKFYVFEFGAERLRLSTTYEVEN